MNRMHAAFLLLGLLIPGGFLAWAQLRLKVPPGQPDLVIIEGPSKHVVTSDMADASRAMVGRPAPGFAKPATDDKTHLLDEMLRLGPVVLIFIKDGCPCSEAAQPFFNEVHAAYPRASIRGVINVRAEAAKRWADRFGVRYPLLLDPEEEMVRDYEIQNSAYVVVIDRRGEIAEHWPGYSVSMLRDLGSLIARLTGASEKPLDLAEAPVELYTGCPYDR